MKSARNLIKVCAPSSVGWSKVCVRGWGGMTETKRAREDAKVSSMSDSLFEFFVCYELEEYRATGDNAYTSHDT